MQTAFRRAEPEGAQGCSALALCPLCLGGEESYFWHGRNVCWNRSPLLTWDAAVPQTQLSARARGCSGCSVQMDILYEITSYIFSLALQTAVKLARARGSELAQETATDVDLNLAEHICIWEWSLPESFFFTGLLWFWLSGLPPTPRSHLAALKPDGGLLFGLSSPIFGALLTFEYQYLMYLCYM